MNCLVEETRLGVAAAWSMAPPTLHPVEVRLARGLMRLAVRLGFLQFRSSPPGWRRAAVRVAAGLGCRLVAQSAEVLGWRIRRGLRQQGAARVDFAGGPATASPVRWQHGSSVARQYAKH